MIEMQVQGWKAAGNQKGPKKRSKGQVTFEPVYIPYTRDVLTEVSNNVTMCYGRKPCGIDAKLPKGDCDAKVPNQQNCVFALTKAVHPLSCRYNIRANSQKHKFDH